MLRAGKGLVAAAAVVVVLGGAVVAVPTLLFSDGVDYSHAATIKKTHDYQDAALLSRAARGRLRRA